MDEIELILDWAKDKPWFDTKFVESVRDWFDDKGFITNNQQAALQNIIDEFSIE